LPAVELELWPPLVTWFSPPLPLLPELGVLPLPLPQLARAHSENKLAPSRRLTVCP
jgi:hypothetical protein